MGTEGNTGRFLLEDRSAALTQEMTDLKELVREVTEGVREHAEEGWERLGGVVNEAVRTAQEGGVEARGDGGARAVGHGGEGADGGNHLGGWGEARVNAPGQSRAAGTGRAIRGFRCRSSRAPAAAMARSEHNNLHRTGDAATSGEIHNLNLLDCISDE